MKNIKITITYITTKLKHNRIIITKKNSIQSITIFLNQIIFHQNDNKQTKKIKPYIRYKFCNKFCAHRLNK